MGANTQELAAHHLATELAVARRTHTINLSTLTAAFNTHSLAHIPTQHLNTTCRWGYRDVDTLTEVVANYSAAGLPLETLWSDIEYMPKRFWTMEMDECEFAIGRDSSVGECSGGLIGWSDEAAACVAASQPAAADGGGRRPAQASRVSSDIRSRCLWPSVSIQPTYTCTRISKS